MRKREEIPVLIAEVTAELAKLEGLVAKLSGQIGRFGSEETVESAALRLHNFYTGCERIWLPGLPPQARRRRDGVRACRPAAAPGWPR